MSESALTCPRCESASVRRSRRVNVQEMTRMMMGVYPFRCNACGERFWASVWLFSIWRVAKCPRCLNLSLTDWPSRRYHMGLWTQVMTMLGAHKHRCSRCRHNFVSFLQRMPEYQGQPAEFDDLDFDDQRSASFHATAKETAKPAEVAHSVSTPDPQPKADQN